MISTFFILSYFIYENVSSNLSLRQIQKKINHYQFYRRFEKITCQMKQEKDQGKTPKDQQNNDKGEFYDISKPPRIMTALQAYSFERRAQKRIKQKIDKSLVTKFKPPAIEWRQLDEQKKEKYIASYKSRKQQLQQIKSDFRVIVGQSKKSNAYICYFRQRYPLLAQAYPEKIGKQLTKMIANNWSKLSAYNKLEFEKEAEKQNNEMRIDGESKKKLIKKYEEKVAKLKLQIQKEKQEILDKYSIKGISVKKIKKKQSLKNIRQSMQQKVSLDKEKQERRLKMQIKKIWQQRIQPQKQKEENQKNKVRKSEIKPYTPTQPARKQKQKQLANEAQVQMERDGRKGRGRTRSTNGIQTQKISMQLRSNQKRKEEMDIQERLPNQGKIKGKKK